MFDARYILIVLSSLVAVSVHADQASSQQEEMQIIPASLQPLMTRMGFGPIFAKPIAQKEDQKDIIQPQEKENCFREEDFKYNRAIFSIYGEWIYFKAIEDSIKYAQSTPQSPTLTPVSSSVDQKFDYTSGLRIGLGYRLPRNSWGISANWMWYETHDPQKKDSSDNFGILAVLALPTYALPQNSQVNKVTGKWSLKLDAIDFKLNIPLHISKRFILTPSGGVMAGFVNQKIQVKYEDFLIFQPIANTPQKIEGKNNMWGIGPEIGLEARFLFCKQIGLFFTGNLAGLCGQFRLKTTYRDFLNAPSQAKLTVKGKKDRVSLVEQMQAGIETHWQFGRKNHKWMELNISGGWEVQVWTRQMRLNMFDTFVEPSDGSDLTLYGPFVKGELRF
jgi:Legionella pneumophila major outer membrane protein precursor